MPASDVIFRFIGRDELSQPTKKAERSLEELEDAAEDANRDLTAMDREVSTLSSTLDRFAGPLAIGAAVAGLGNLAFAASRTAREAQVLARGLGLGAGEVANFGQAYRLIGEDISAFRGDLAAAKRGVTGSSH